MTAPALPWSTCKSLARAAWTRARALAHPTREHAAEAAGVDRSHLSRWESERCDHPAPIAVLWSVTLMPDAELDALVAQCRDDRAAQRERSVLATPEGALSASLQEAAAVLSSGVGALTDGHVSREERASMRPGLATLVSAIRRTLRVWDAADAAPGGDVVPMRAGGRR